MEHQTNYGNFILGDNEIELGKFEDNSFDFVFIDPPYIISQKSGYGRNSKDSTKK